MGSGDRRKLDRRHNNVHVDVERRTTERRKADRRSASRIPLELWMEEVSGDDVYFRRSGNLGEGGVYFDKAIPHVLGTMVTLKFALPGEREMVVARGQVVSAAGSAAGLGMSIKFITVEGNGQNRIRDFIRRLA
jgi:hypothetical protein